MTTNTRKIWILMFCLALAFLAGVPHLALPATDVEEQVGRLTVTGTVRVNGKPAATGDILASGSQVQTAKGSSAVVSLGKLGRVEALPSTTMKMIYDEAETRHSSASFSILLGDGGVRVSTGQGKVWVQSGATATRPILRTEQNVFTVDTICGNTFVSVAKGKVEMRAGHGVKQIAAGGQDMAGQGKAGCTVSSNQ